MRRKRISALCAAMLVISMLCPATVNATSESEELAESTDSEVVSLEGNYAEGEAIVKVTGEFYQYQQRTRAVMPFETTTLFTMTDGAVSDEEEISTYAMDSQGEEIILAQSEDLTTDELIQEVQSYPGVVYAEPNYDIYACEVNDPYYEQQWHLHELTEVAGAANVETVWDTGATGSEELVVAVIDSGVDYGHPDLKSNMWKDAKGYYGYDFVYDDPDPMDVAGHGTHVAGIIGAQGDNGIGVSGVCQSVKMAALRILGDDGGGYTSWGIQAYQYMIEQKDAGTNFVAANNSWGSSVLSRAMEEIMAYAGSQYGIVSVISSGNESADRDTTPGTPRSSNGSMALTVNASDSNGIAASFSNFGKNNTDLYAPGVEILSTYQRSDVAFDINDPAYLIAGTQCDLSKTENIQPIWLSENGDPLENPETVVGIQYDSNKNQLSWSTNQSQPATEDQSVGVEIAMGDLSNYKEQAKNLGMRMGFTNTWEFHLGRYLEIQVKQKDGSWKTLGGKTAVEYGEQVLPLSARLSSVEDIDWSAFTVRIMRKLSYWDVTNNCLTFTLGGIALGMDTDSYGLMSGTSMAAPVVTGAVALLASYYGSTLENMAEIRARIVGGVTRTDAMGGTCVSGGYLNLAKAMDDPYPVLNTLTQSDDAQGVLDGYFFGDTAGTLMMDGMELNVTSWSDGKLQFQLPAGLTEGAHQFVVTDSEGESGQDSFLMTAIPGDEAAQDAVLFEQLQVPALKTLGVELNEDEGNSYSMASLDGKIYVTGRNIYVKGDNNEQDIALLIYDTVTGVWSSDCLMLPRPKLETTFKITAGTDRLYLAESEINNYGKFQLSVYEYVVETEALRTLTDHQDMELSENVYDWSSAYDGTYLWFVGGRQMNDMGTNIVPSKKVRRISTVTGQSEMMPSMQTARADVQVQLVNGTLV